MDGIIAEIIDRLIAESNRRAIAEHDLNELEEQFHQLEDAVSAKDDRIEKLEQELKIKTDTVIYQLNRFEDFKAKYDKLEAELTALKGGEPDAGEV